MASNEGWYEPCWTEHVPGSVPGKRDECVCAETSSRNCPQHQSQKLSIHGRHPDSERFHELLDEIGALHDLKQKDYGRVNDPFANVRASEAWNVEPWVGAMIRLNDKVKRLQQFANKGVLHNEGVIDSLLDISVYALIALVLYEQTNATEQTPLEGVS